MTCRICVAVFDAPAVILYESTAPGRGGGAKPRSTAQTEAFTQTLQGHSTLPSAPCDEIFRPFDGAGGWKLRQADFCCSRKTLTIGGAQRAQEGETLSLGHGHGKVQPHCLPNELDGLAMGLAISSGVVVTVASQYDWPKPCGEICTDRSPLWRHLRRSASNFREASSLGRRQNPYPRCPASSS